MNLYSLFNKKPQDTKVLVAMSGGVDSSVVAILLHKLGYNVIGCTLQLAEPSCGLGACCTGRDLFDVKDMCAQANFPHILVKARDEFKQKVINNTVESYAKGMTPSPCVWCNSKVRFDFLYKEAEKQGCDGFVTGHYAYVYNNPSDEFPFSLNAGVDPIKDQSYFLSMLPKYILDKVRFPLGNMTKTTVRKIARALQIPVSEKKDSQDLCFVKENYVQTLWNLAPNIFQPGEIVDQNNKMIGTHDGIAQYTIGQRKGIKISSSQPMYVTDISYDKNQVQIGTKEHGSCEFLLLEQINLLDNYHEGMFIEAKLRAKSGNHLARLWNNGTIVQFLTPALHAARGQICVMYVGRKIIGAGLIKDFIRTKKQFLN